MLESRRIFEIAERRHRRRVDDLDFDLTVQRFSFSSTPGDSLRSFFSSQAAAKRGSQNLAGISDPVIDALIDKIIAADNRATLTARAGSRLSPVGQRPRAFRHVDAPRQVGLLRLAH
jgi:microcin C transport system substrate-binding protein